LNKGLKQQLYNLCLEALNTRIEVAKKAMEDAQNSANEEGKSSMGDKYETARAMGQIVRDMNAKQLNEALKELTTLKLINPETQQTVIQAGSIVVTSGGNYFIAVSAGMLKVDGKTWVALSPATPLAQVMLNKRVGDTFEFRGKKEAVLEVG
jgi:transcription elongation GreA/GreB family factor